MLAMDAQQKQGRGRGTAAPEEDTQDFQGEPSSRLPTDVGGIGQGHPSSGSGTSLSRKSFPDGITPQNYEVVKNTLQTAVDFGWTKSKTVNELRKNAMMTVRSARQLVKNEFDSVRRWEDGKEE